MFFKVILIKIFIKIIIPIFIILIFITFLLNYTHYSATQIKEESITVPIIMYHSVLKDPSKTDKYTITPTLLEEDLKYLKDHNYCAIFVSDLINYIYKDTPLPENPIIITFDDGYLNNLTYALPLLQKYNMKATISIIGSYTEKSSHNNDPNVNYAHLTWEDIIMLKNSGIIEIANHSFKLHDLSKRKGSMKKFGETINYYSSVMQNDLNLLQKLLYEYCGISCNVFAYPYGLISTESIPIVKSMGFLASLSCEEKVNKITKDPDCIYLLGRFNRHGKISTEQFMKKIKKPSTQ